MGATAPDVEAQRPAPADPASTAAPAVARSARAAWWAQEFEAQPNFCVEIGAELLMPPALEKPVSSSASIVDTILGTAIRGQAQTTGQVAMRLIPSDHTALFEFLARGQTSAQSQGVSGPVTVSSTSDARFAVLSRVSLDERHITFSPPKAAVNSRSQLHDVQVQTPILPGLLQSLAWRRAQRLQPQADAIAASRAKVRYEQAMNETLSGAIGRANQAYQENVREPLSSRAALWERARFTSTDDALQIQVLYGREHEPRAESPAPAMSRRHGALLELHESLPQNLAQRLLRGATVTDGQLAWLMKIALGEIPREAREFRLGEHLAPWSITLADDVPVEMHFRQGQVKIGVRIARLTIGERSQPMPAFIEATYLVRYSPSGPQLLRERAVQVEVDPYQPDPGVEELEFLSRKADSFFIPEIWFDGLVPPAGGPFDHFAQLSLAELQVTDGWFALGFSRDLEPLAVR